MLRLQNCKSDTAVRLRLRDDHRRPLFAHRSDGCTETTLFARALAGTAKIGGRHKVCTVCHDELRACRWRGKSLVTKNTFPQELLPGHTISSVVSCCSDLVHCGGPRCNAVAAKPNNRSEATQREMIYGIAEMK